MRTVSINKHLKLRIMRGLAVEGLTVRDSDTSPLSTGVPKSAKSSSPTTKQSRAIIFFLKKRKKKKPEDAEKSKTH